jgi:hypothetical protein
MVDHRAVAQHHDDGDHLGPDVDGYGDCSPSEQCGPRRALS